MARLSAAAIDAMRSATVRGRPGELWVSALTGPGPRELAAVMKRDYEHWGPVIKASGFKADNLNILFASQTEDPALWLPRLRQALPADRFSFQRMPDIDVALVASAAAGHLRAAQAPEARAVALDGCRAVLADPAFPRGVRLRAVDPEWLPRCPRPCCAVLDWHHVTILYREQQQARHWRRLKQYLASDRTVGSSGSASARSDVARKLAALGFHVAVWSRRPKDLPGVTCLTQLEAVLERATWWSACCRLPRTPRAS